MSDVDYRVLRLVERLVSDYAGQVETTSVIHAVHETFRDHPGASAADLERMARVTLDPA